MCRILPGVCVLATLYTLIAADTVSTVQPPRPAADMASKLARLRGLMRQGPLALRAYLIPTGDAHQSEYISEHDARRAYISGFTGSAGTAVVTDAQALLWTDGRYYLQAETQLDGSWELMKESLPATPTREKWLVKNLPPRSNVGANPALMAYSEWEPLKKALHKAGHTLVPVETDLVDLVWEELDGGSRPARPANPIFPLAANYTGRTVAEKLKEIREKMEEKSAQLYVVTALDEVAYLLNLRGSDIPYNPVFYAYCCVTRDQLVLFTDRERLTGPAMEQLHAEGVEGQLTIRPYSEILTYVEGTVKEALLEQTNTSDYVVWITHGSSQAVHLAAAAERPEGGRAVDVVTDLSPVALMKAVKNQVETQGMVACHVRDGAALARYFSWLEQELTVKGRTDLTEISAADELERIRSQLPDYMGLSFSTISSSGPNGAIIHYKPEPDTDRRLTVDELYLCDSGGQYRDGTTDVTRTLHFGTPTPQQVEAFTLVLKGQIALGTAVFPNKIKGNVLDTLARQSLWSSGLDYEHGTGHGVGAFLNVHEGPMGISWRQMPDDPGLSADMFLSNEPGYYEDGQYGIRLEDIIRVVTLVPPGDVPQDSLPLPRGLKGNFAGRGALGFQTVTVCPIQKKMINIALLTEKEIEHVDSYHRMVREQVSPLLQAADSALALKWLEQNTRPLRE